jgi:hypothetical protein
MGIPLFLATLFQQQGQLSHAYFYVIWWLVGVIFLTQIWAVKELQRVDLRKDWLRPLERNFRVAFIVFPVASVCWHALSMHWVYDFPFYMSYLSPIILGIGVSLSVVTRRGTAKCIRLRWLTPMAALLPSIIFPNQLVYALQTDSFEDVLVSPLRVMLLAIAVVYSSSFFEYRRRSFLPASAVALLMAGAGHTVSSIVDTLFHYLERFIPRTSVEFFTMAIVGAFVFLALGAAVSLSQRRVPRKTARPLP